MLTSAATARAKVMTLVSLAPLLGERLVAAGSRNVTMVFVV
ncbi:hypothetical protein [Leifsonia sp. P73]